MGAKGSTRMSGKFLLDTSVIVALFRNDETIRTKFGELAEVLVPAIALGELYFGALVSTRIEENLLKISEFASRAAILACDSDTAEYNGQIKNNLKSKGRPLPENEIWIAAVAQ